MPSHRYIHLCGARHVVDQLYESSPSGAIELTFITLCCCERGRGKWGVQRPFVIFPCVCVPSLSWQLIALFHDEEFGTAIESEGQQNRTEGVFLRHLYIKCIILPRQARDKHRETSKKDGVSHLRSFRWKRSSPASGRGGSERM